MRERQLVQKQNGGLASERSVDCGLYTDLRPFEGAATASSARPSPVSLSFDCLRDHSQRHCGACGDFGKRPLSHGRCEIGFTVPMRLYL
jgi:hypothetical protein